MSTIKLNSERIGRMSVGVKTSIIREGDDLKEIVIDSCLKAVGEFHEKAVIGVTEAVVAIAQGNFATPADIQQEIARLYPGQSELTLMYPIQSRNRFMNIARAIAESEQIEKLNIVLSYPCDEVGNRLVSDELLWQKGVGIYEDSFSAEEFCQKFGSPKHLFTGKNYIKEFEAACCGKAEIMLTNDMELVADLSDNVLVCTIREGRRSFQKSYMKSAQVYVQRRVFTLADILSVPVNGSGYSPEYGLYGSNMMADGKLKLMPRNCKEFVEDIQNEILRRYGVHVEVMVYGDGAFKDPVGEIWELADPVACLAATSGLKGTPKEVKLKYLASKYPDKSQKELQEIVANEKQPRLATDKIDSEASLGTTPRQLTDLFASWADLTTGSGDEQTPVVYSVGFLK